jgi:putative transposase
MLLVERHQIQGTPEIVELCRQSKELYNKCNYYMRKQWFSNLQNDDWTIPLPDINLLAQLVHDESSFKKLHNTKTAKQTVRKVLSDWSNFRKALAAYKKDPSKFAKKPRPPHYKERLAQVIFYNETIKKKPLKQGIITPTNGCFSIKSNRQFKQVVITPKRFGFVVDVQYEKELPHKVKGKGVCCIDIGLNTLAAITSDQFSPILVNGRIVKSINQWFNKHPSKWNSRKRHWRLENYFHNTSKMIVELCVKTGCGTIIIGKNDGWKQEMHLGKKTNQNFQYVPFFNLIQKIAYKASIVGIKVVFTEEAYTSKASFLDRDPLPVYGEAEPVFSGKRVKRGLYRAANGRLLNADVNGSANIGRKVIRDEDLILRLDRSLAARPLAINPLR